MKPFVVFKINLGIKKIIHTFVPENNKFIENIGSVAELEDARDFKVKRVHFRKLKM